MPACRSRGVRGARGTARANDRSGADESFREDKSSAIESLAGRLGLAVRDREALAAAVDRPFQPAGRAASVDPQAFFGANLARLRAAAEVAS